MLISFQEALQSSEDSERTVLLGNGFSIAGDSVFNYRNLFEGAQIDDSVRNVFKELETYDFEVVISKVENAYNLLEIYTKKYPELVRELKDSSDALRRSFAQVISLKHALYQTIFSPRNSNEIPNRSCFTFLSNFKKVFTTNYDLLLYWAINLSNEKLYIDNGIIIPRDDGFRRAYDNLIWYGNYDQSEQSVFYLHGALFLYEEDDLFIKMERNKDEDLLSIVTENIIQHRNLPIIVLEGESKNKISKIAEYPYLYDALQHLGHLNGNLFIFGHSLNPSDDHIFTKIKESNFTKIFISVFDENKIDIMKTRAHSLFDNPKKGREIYLFNAATANVWV